MANIICRAGQNILNSILHIILRQTGWRQEVKKILKTWKNFANLAQLDLQKAHNTWIMHLYNTEYFAPLVQYRWWLIDGDYDYALYATEMHYTYH